MTWFGDYLITELDTYTIRSVYSYIRKNEMLSENALFKMHQKISQLMKNAIWEEIISRNPCDPIRISKPDGEERESLTHEEATRLDRILFTTLVTACKCVVMIALHTGMRRGEILGLAWGRIDFEHNYLLIVEQYSSDETPRNPKSKKRRTYRPVSFDDKAKAYLLIWKRLQEKHFEKHNAKCIEKHHGFGPNEKLVQTDDTPVITNGNGGYMDPNLFDRWFRQFCVDNELGHYSEVYKKRDSKGIMRTHKRGYKGLCLHMLRHTQSSLLSDEVDIITIKNRLGHEQLETTMRYTHKPPQDDVRASEMMGELLSSGEERIDQLSRMYPDICESFIIE